VIHKCIYEYSVNTHAELLYYTRYNTFQEREREEGPFFAFRGVYRPSLGLGGA